jgi:hypothetical protein
MEQAPNEPSSSALTQCRAELTCHELFVIDSG